MDEDPRHGPRRIADVRPAAAPVVRQVRHIRDHHRGRTRRLPDAQRPRDPRSRAVPHAHGPGRVRGRPGEELYRLREALSLWQGQPLANVASRLLQQDAVPALEQERLRVLERVCDLELAAGNCHQVLVDLYESARRHPVRERFTEQLIEALYRTGRQAEALAEFRTVRDRLRDELGIDPGQGLRRLELAILRAEDLAPAPRETVRAVTAVEVPALPAGAAGAARPARAVLPVPAFAGRENDRRAMAAGLTSADGPRLVVVSGAPGIGKSALARQTAYEVQDAFPGGVFTLQLARPDGTAIAVEEAAQLLPEPGGGRRLIVLDGAAGAWQVLPLLPAAGDAAVLVTSRRGLAAVVATHGGAVHRLDVLRPAEAYGLLAGLMGAERIAAEPAAVRELATVCGHFPLALRIAAGRLLTRPGLSVADCAAWLAEDPPRGWPSRRTPGSRCPRCWGRRSTRWCRSCAKRSSGSAHAPRTRTCRPPRARPSSNSSWRPGCWRTGRPALTASTISFVSTRVGTSARTGRQ
ncbi:BTAD domain-containing putative transcriptional regulator [Streptomyces sp. MS1.HAVA.3]|uniref:BTAD domain-containing putative transcriptional regulator n=1 Tax=Streptomyces caledonius TaxID=3134107 RepID=A0ABU8TZ55_9ACTN